jgi:predicted N-acetyltransferase YhbS
MTKSVGKIEVKLMEAAEQEDFMEFLKGNLDTFDKFEQFWKWRQENKTICGGEEAAIAKYQSKVVGCVGIVPVDIRGCDDNVRACWQQDSFVDGAMRGKGVGKRLVEKATEGWDLLLAKGTGKTMYGLRKSLGFLDVRNSNNLLLVCRPRRLRFSGKMLAEYALWIWRMVIIPPKKNGRLRAVRIDEFDRSFDAVEKNKTRENVVRLQKDHRYLNWRYFLCPGKKYDIFRAGNEEARGAVVVARSRSDPEEAWIVDLICTRDDKQCGFALIREAVRYLEDAGASRIWVFSTLSTSRKWFMRFGFVPTKFTPRFTFRAVNNELTGKLKTAEWDFWHGDGDVELYM